MSAGFLLLVSALFVLSACAWIAFGRVTMGRIEKQLKSEGIPRPASWDIFGYRIFSYAWAVVFPEERWKASKDFLLDANLIRRYARPVDRVLGILFIATTHSGALIVFLSIFILDI